MSNIPPLDLKRQYQMIGAEINASVLEVLASGAYIGGQKVQDFEAQFSQYIGSSHSVACNSGTDALYLALRSLNIGAGDEVITTPFTFIATAETISSVGAKPVFVDIDPTTYNIDPNQIIAAITPQTKAIIPVHLFGKPVNMTEIMAIANEYNLAVIEDCAQAVGAEWDNQKVGNIGTIGCFSFFPTKNLGGCGDGGAITTSNPELATQIRIIREHGSRERYYHETIGVNSRLDAIQAGILTIKLPYLDQWNQARKEASDRYHQLLSAIDQIILPSEIAKGKSVWNQYTIRIKSPNSQDSGSYRHQVREKMIANGVIPMIYYPLPLHLQKVYTDLGYAIGSFPITEEISHQVLSLPLFPEITPEEQERVVYALKGAL